MSPQLQLLHNHLSLLLIHQRQTAQTRATVLLKTVQTFTTIWQENVIGSSTRIQVYGNASSKNANGNSIKTTVHGLVFTTNPVTYLATSLAKKLMIWNRD